MDEEIVRDYLGDEGFEVSREWYLYALESEWTYVIFIVRRAYLMAQIMEEVSEKKMERESAAVFLTDAAFFSHSKEVAQFYVESHRIPNILICEDSIVHGRSIERFVNDFYQVLWEEVCALSLEEDEEKFQSEFIRAINIHVITRAAEGALLPEKYMMKVHSCIIQDLQKLHEFSYELSKLIFHSRKANAAYIYSKIVDQCWYNVIKENYAEKQNKMFYEIELDGIKEKFLIEFIEKSDMVKGVMTLRIIPLQDKYRVIPFVFLPNLTKEETERLWNACVEEIGEYISQEEVSENYSSFLQVLKHVNNKRSYNEWLTLILSLRWLTRLEWSVELQKEEIDPVEIQILARNYDVIGFEKTGGLLEKVIDVMWKMAADDQKSAISTVIADCMDADNFLIMKPTGKQIEDFEEKRIVKEIEDYWIDSAMRKENIAYKVSGMPRFALPSNMENLIRPCEDVLRDLTDGYGLTEVGYIFAQFQQMMDRGIIGIYSSCGNGDVQDGFLQCVKPGEMSLTIYPERMKAYIPLLSKIYQYCEYWEKDWEQAVKNFCEDEEVSVNDKNQIEDFIQYLKTCGQDPRQWDIDYDVCRIASVDWKDFSQEIEWAVKNYHYWQRFELCMNGQSAEDTHC